MTPLSVSLPRFDGKVALVTGAAKGLGRALTLALARQGAHVVALSRRKADLENLDNAARTEGLELSLVPLDLRDGAKVDALGPTLYQRWGKLDVFIGNAAVLGPLSPLTHLSETDWSTTLAINLTANWRLIRTLDPLLRLAPQGRALFVSSAAAQHCRAYWGGYSVSKAALEALAKTYAHEVETTDVRVNVLDPGRMRTRMRAQAFPGEDAAALPSPEEAVPLALSLVAEDVTANGERFGVGSVAAGDEKGDAS